MAEKLSPITTKGDLIIGDNSGNSSRLGVGTNTHVLTADSTVAGGIKWAAVAGGSGITRTVVVTSGSITLGNTASTDYMYFVAGAHTLSMPAAAGNTNRYTIKNNHSANITIDTAGAENIEGAASISIAPEEAVDIMSDGTNWFVI